MRTFVTSVPQYRAVATHGFQCLKTILSGELGHQFFFPHLYLLLQQQNCCRSGDFAGFIYLLQPVRYCMNCVLNNAPTPQQVAEDRVSDCFTGPLASFAGYVEDSVKALRR
jgi:hypothetical protein